MFQRRVIDNGFKSILTTNIAFEFDWHPGPDVAYEEKPEKPWGILYAIPAGGPVWVGLNGAESVFDLTYQISCGGIGVEQVTALADRGRAVLTQRDEYGKFNYDYPALESGHYVSERSTVEPIGAAEPQPSGLYQVVDRYRIRAGVTL